MGPLDRTRVSLFTASNVLETVRPGDSPDRELTRPRLKWEDDHVIGLDPLAESPELLAEVPGTALRAPGLYRTLVERDQLVHRAELCKVGERAEPDDNPATIQPGLLVFPTSASSGDPDPRSLGTQRNTSVSFLAQLPRLVPRETAAFLIIYRYGSRAMVGRTRLAKTIQYPVSSVDNFMRGLPGNFMLPIP